MTLSEHQSTLAFSGIDPNFNSNGPRKRLKRDGFRYVPGGPGGGGHWVKTEPRRTSRSRQASTPREPVEKNTPRRSWRERTRDAAPATAARPRRERAPPSQPSFDSAAEAVASVDGYKPREERGWEEFHPDLDLDAGLTVFSANEVDGVDGSGSQTKSPRGSVSGHNVINSSRPQTRNGQPLHNALPMSTPKRRPGRPPGRRAQSGALLSGLGMAPSPPAQRPLPLPSQNPRERLSLPKPSYRTIASLDAYEEGKEARQTNYVSKVMENLGYQKNEIFDRSSDKEMIRYLDIYRDEDLESGTTAQVEYDMDEQDKAWLDAYNIYRREQDSIKDPIIEAILEVTITQIEKEWHALEKKIPKPNPKPPQTHRPRSGSSAAVNGETPQQAQGEEQDSKCAICDDGDCENTNAIVFCDGCDLAVHQECYGVPYIPEGQWLCRKCQAVGKATTTCIFCPNTEGAFKTTTELKWAHLLCAIWIPEVTISNTTFMEPVAQVAEVPHDRWKLECYICNQKMGACIQCGSRSCYKAFHVTCARRAKLFLKMKSSHGLAATFDASVLKAYCHKHVPDDWRSEHDVDTATADAVAYYRREMKGQKWADSQQSALTIGSSIQNPVSEQIEELKMEDDAQFAAATPAQRKRRLEIQKRIWRLPSGAPIVPDVVCKAVEAALVRFNPLPKRKEFVAEACKYWTLKREARRGAALIKRLQFQMENFSTAEIARRDYAAMGRQGGLKLARRVEFARRLEKEMSVVQMLCKDVIQREELKIEDARSLKVYLDTVYFPLNPLLSPILERARKYDEKTNLFTAGFDRMQAKLDARSYTSASSFSDDLSSVLRSAVGADVEVHLLSKPLKDLALQSGEKEAAKVAKRILKYVQDLLEKAFRAEASLAEKSYDSGVMQLRELEKFLDATSKARLADAPKEDPDGAVHHIDQDDNQASLTNGISSTEQDQAGGSDPDTLPPANERLSDSKKQAAAGLNDLSGEVRPAPEDDNSLLAPLRAGGLLSWVEKFQPNGLTVQEEHWAGAERALSADLSDIDDDLLDGMSVDVDNAPVTPPASDENKDKKGGSKKTPTKKRKRKVW